MIAKMVGEEDFLKGVSLYLKENGSFRLSISFRKLLLRCLIRLTALSLLFLINSLLERENRGPLEGYLDRFWSRCHLDR
jgi:hypothetical protein